jgi:hypothetical protein
MSRRCLLRRSRIRSGSTYGNEAVDGDTDYPLERAGFEVSGDFVNGQQVIRKRQRAQNWLPADWLAKTHESPTSMWSGSVPGSGLLLLCDWLGGDARGQYSIAPRTPYAQTRVCVYSLMGARYWLGPAVVDGSWHWGVSLSSFLPNTVYESGSTPPSCLASAEPAGFIATGGGESSRR